jgi:hypothetical protein
MQNHRPMPRTKIDLDDSTRAALAKSFIENVVLAQYRQLTGWQRVTAQSAQLDSGYLSQHLVSLISGVMGRGPGSRGKGHDLLDGSEIKAASTLGAIDEPRWDHSAFASKTKIATYLENPHIYFVLLDTLNRHEEFPLRIRVWRVSPRTDSAFAQVVRSWAAGRSSGNFQLHPPCWREGSVARNKCGHLKLPLIFEAVQKPIDGVDLMEIVVWNLRRRKSRPHTQNI